MSNRKWADRITGLGILSAAIAVVILLIAGPGHRFGIVPVRLAVLGGMGAALIAAFGVLALLLGLALKGGAGRRGRAIVALLVAGAITVQMLNVYRTAKQVPPIHDITTDTENPPQFDALLGARADAANPPEYAGAETAGQQAEAYPDIAPLVLDGVTPDEALAAAEAAAESMGLEAIVLQPEKNLLEATDVTFWYGYRDDVVVRATPVAGGTRVDIRSKSRVGVSDLGANAARVRALSEAIRRRVDG